MCPTSRIEKRAILVGRAYLLLELSSQHRLALVQLLLILNSSLTIPLHHESVVGAKLTSAVYFNLDWIPMLDDTLSNHSWFFQDQMPSLDVPDSIIPFILFVSFLIAFCIIYWTCTCCSGRWKERFNSVDDRMDRIRVIRPFVTSMNLPGIATLSINTPRLGRRNSNCFYNSETYEAPPPSYEDVVKQPPPYKGTADGEGVANPAGGSTIVIMPV